MAKILGKEEESQSCGTSTLALHQSEQTDFLMDISQLPERDRQHVSRLLEEKQVCVASGFCTELLIFQGSTIHVPVWRHCQRLFQRLHQRFHI